MAKLWHLTCAAGWVGIWVWILLKWVGFSQTGQLSLVWFERSLHSAQVSGQSCPWPWKLMTSQAVERTWFCTGGSGANGLIKVPKLNSREQYWTYSVEDVYHFPWPRRWVMDWFWGKYLPDIRKACVGMNLIRSLEGSKLKSNIQCY